MRLSKIHAAVAATLVLAGATLAQTPGAEQDHSAHHPAGSPPAAGAPAPGVAGTAAPDAIDRQMQAMQEMHQKMQAAKTPAERARLMDEHMKLMQSGAALMTQMRGGPAGMGGMGGMPMQMERRMAMMEHMMQMMVEREAARTGP